MSNQDVTSHKFVAILNKKIEMGKVLNVLGHLTASLVAQASDETRDVMGIVDYMDGDGNSHKASKNSFVILQADNGNQIRNARNFAKEKGVTFVDFTSTMQEGTFVEQLDNTRQTPESALDYYGLLLFGEIEKVNEISRKFSLWR